MTATFQTIADDLTFLDDWEDRYRYIIDLGQSLTGLPDDAKIDANRVKGCVSQVWLTAHRDGETLQFEADSDAQIVRGLVALLMALYSGRPAQEILADDPQARLAPLGLDKMLSPQRSNGLVSMVKRIRAEAEAATQSAA